MKRKYNYNLYKLCKGTNKIIRDRVSDNPLEKIERTGLTGKAVSDMGNGLLENPIRDASYKLTGLIYDKKHDKPYKGSVLYTANYLLIKKILKVVFTVILGIGAFGILFKFLNSNLTTQLKMSGGLVSILFFTYICNKIKSIFRK